MKKNLAISAYDVSVVVLTEIVQNGVQIREIQLARDDFELFGREKST